MKKKVTQEEWFAAASAQDLWATLAHSDLHVFSEDAAKTTGTNLVLFNKLFRETEKVTENEAYVVDIADQAFLAAQIGCERAGL